MKSDQKGVRLIEAPDNSQLNAAAEETTAAATANGGCDSKDNNLW
jgi:hypothetical protein